MTIRVAGYENLIGIESELKDLIDTCFKLYNLGNLHGRLSSQPILPITQTIKERRLVE